MSLKRQAFVESCQSALAWRTDGLDFRALLFDMCGTLYDHRAWQPWLYGVVSRTGGFVDYETFGSTWCRFYEPRVGAGGAGLWEAVREMLERFGRTPAQIDELEAGVARRLKSYAERVRPYPGLATTLGRLASHGWRLAAIANAAWSRDDAEALLAELGFADWCEVVETAGPSPGDESHGRYDRVCERLDLSPSSVAFLSTSTEELAAASATGLTTIRLGTDRRGADHSVRYFAELLQLADPPRVRLAA